MMRTPDYYTRALRSAAAEILGQMSSADAEGSSSFPSRMPRAQPNDYYTRNM